MCDDLFFIAMIVWALRQPDPVSATREALERIARMGQEPRYRRGYQQFLQWVAWALAPELPEAAEAAAVPVPEDMERPQSVALLVEKGDMVLATIALDADSGTRVIMGLDPGAYRLRFDTGRVLWEGQIEAKDVVHLPGRPIKLAARDEFAAEEPLLELPIPGETLIVRVSRGIESGTMVVEWRSWEGSR